MEKVNSVIVIGLFLATAVTGVISRIIMCLTGCTTDHAALRVTFVSMNMFYLVTAAFRHLGLNPSSFLAGSRYHRSAG